MFITSIVFYILGVMVHLFFIDCEYFVTIVGIIIFSVAFYFYLKKSKFSAIYSYCLLLFIFFMLGLLVVSMHLKFNKTVLLINPIYYSNFYGEITQINRSNYNDKSKIFVNNLIINGSLETPSSAKLTYNKTNNLEIGDIIQATAAFFPPSKPLLPYGFNFQKYAFFNQIGANGYIVGNITVIENYNDSNYFIKTSTLRDNVANRFANMVKKDSKNDRTLPFLIAITIGQYAFLPPEDMYNLRNTSLSHYISISGYHISLIAAILFFSLRRILSIIPRITLFYDTKKFASLFTIIILLFYLFILGDNLPAARAIIMTTGVLLAILFNFSAISLNSLFLAGFILLLFMPQAMLSAGFLLSFFATMAIIVFFNFKIVQKIYNYSKNNLLKKIVIGLFITIVMTFFIEITILPILMYFFGSVPLLGIIANLLVSPLFSFFIMPSMVLYFIMPSFISILFLRIAEIAMSLVLNIAAFLSSFSFSTYYVDFFPSYLLVIFLFAYIGFAVIKNKYRYSMIIPIVSVFIYYIFVVKPPDVIISDKLSLVAFKESEKPLNYIFSEGKTENFTKSVWFHNPKINIDKQIEEALNFDCEDSHCVGKIKNTIISFSKNLNYVKDDCGEVDIIILTQSNKVSCTSAKIIDKDYIAKRGSITINVK